MVLSARIGDQEVEWFSELEQHFSKYRKGIVGLTQTFQSPYGEMPIIYADWTASGRLYRPIEEKIMEEFAPFMANTHTESNQTGSFMTNAYHHAKKIIKRHVNASESDALILDGFGMTSVINKLQRMLGLRIPEAWMPQVQLRDEDRPVVFITHMEHHSNQTSWLETICDVVVLPQGEKGEVNPDALEELLPLYKERPLKIGSFTACSNVTGLMTPYHELARIMHEHDGICIVDFAASAPYVRIDMNPGNPLEALDAIVFSPHKFLGGPGTSGVMVLNQSLYHNQVPDHPGGGTVKWTNPWGGHSYYEDIEVREDGGTPGILQGIRTALCIRLKEEMGVEKMLAREKELLKIILPGLKAIDGIHVLEGQEEERLGIISFMVPGVHYNLIVKLLNDRFGIQVRGGCSCAGTYGHCLLNISKEQSNEIMKAVEEGDLSVKPGWIRFSIHPVMTNKEAHEFLLAMRSIMNHLEEWKQEYVYDPMTNDYFYQDLHREDFDWLFYV
ncbi:aminotransferase class V-fold PLP-dependent enzyme [Pradoshia sp.]